MDVAGDTAEADETEGETGVGTPRVGLDDTAATDEATDLELGSEVDARAEEEAEAEADAAAEAEAEAKAEDEDEAATAVEHVAAEDE